MKFYKLSHELKSGKKYPNIFYSFSKIIKI